MNSIQIETLSKQMDINVSAIEEAIECGLQLNIFYEEMKNDLEAFQIQSDVRPSGKIYDFYNPVVEIYIQKIQAVAEVFNNEYNKEYNEECVLLPITAAFNEIISSDTECEEELSAQEYDDSINYSLYSDNECFEIQKPLEIEEVKIQNILEQQPEEKNQILEDQHFDCVEMKNLKWGNTWCYKCDSAFGCLKCGLGSQKIDSPIIINTVDSLSTANQLVDIQYQKEKIHLTSMESDSCALNYEHISQKGVMLKLYSLCFKEDYNNFPIKQQLDYQTISLDRYPFSENASKQYGNITNSHKLILQKTIIDNNLRFQAPQKYAIVALDIESYDIQDQTKVPMFDKATSYIGMCCLSVQMVENGKSTIEKYCFLYNNRNYHINLQGQNIKINHFETEQAMCLSVFNFIAQIDNGKYPVFVISFNGSSSLFDDSCGYDIPFLYKRSAIRSPLLKKTLKMDTFIDKDGVEKLQVKSQMITSIQGLYNVYFIDIQQRLNKVLSQDQKNQLENQSLDSYLQLYNLRGKESHNYIDLQQRLSTNGSDISDIISYCQRDCDALLDLNIAAGILDINLSVQNLLQIPLYNALFNTDASNVQLYQMREYTLKGYSVCYYASGDSSKYQGAYCKTIDEYKCQIIQECIAPDFASLYPNSTISINGCLSTYLEQQDDNCNVVQIIDVDEHDNMIVTGNVYFSKNKGIIPELLKNLFQQRKDIRNDMKQYNRQSSEYQSLNTKQLAVKLILNTIYGVSGNKNSPLYLKQLAESITSYGRQAIITAKNILEKKGAIYLAADTDSAFCKIPQHINCYKDLQQFMAELNTSIQTEMNSPYLSFEIEEVIRKIHFTRGKKSYIALLAKDDEFKNWQRDIPSNKTELKIRGAPWSKQEKTFRSRIQNQIQNYLDSNKTPIEFFNEYQDIIRQEIKECVEQCNIEQLIQYSERVKLSSAKSLLVKHLKRDYQIFIEGLDYTHVFLKRGSGLKTTRKIPVQAITKQLISQIDQQDLLYNAMSMLMKLLLNDAQIKGLPSNFKIKLEEQEDQLIDPSKMLVQITKITKNGGRYDDVRIVSREQIPQLLYSSAEKKQMVCELIRGQNIRLFFDVDGGQMCQEDLIEIIDKNLQQIMGQVPSHRVLQSGQNKFHIYYDCTVNYQFAKYISQRILDQHPLCGLDLVIYRQDTQLRMPNVPKISGGNGSKVEFKDSRYNCQFDDVKHHFINPDPKHPVFNTPLHTIQKPIIEPEYMHFDKYDYTKDDIILLATELQKMNMPFKIIEKNNTKRVKLQRLQPSMCHSCQVEHHRDCMFAYISKQYIKIYCAHDKNIQKIPITITKAIAQVTQKVQLIQQLINAAECNYISLNNAIHQNNRYFELDILEEVKNNKLICIKSSLGTGKSEQIKRYIEECKDNILIVSHRLSYTANIKSRYPDFVDYSEQSGDLSLQEKHRIICQVESLSRIRQKQGCVLILDEIESILTQLHNHLAKSNDSSQHLIDLIQNAAVVIALDGFLQNNTIQLLDSIRNSSQITERFTAYQNDYKPFQNQVIEMKQYKPSVQQNILDDIMQNLNQGKKIVSMCTSNQLATDIANYIQNQGQYEVTLFTGTDLQIFKEKKMINIKQDAFRNVENYFKVDLLIYTSTITAGVDFNLEWFDKFIHVYVSETCDPQQFIQGTSRVRKFRDTQHIIYYQHKNCYDKPQSPSEILHDAYESFCLKSQQQQLDIWIESRCQSMRYYRSAIVFTQLQELGYKLIDQQNDSMLTGPIFQNNKTYFITEPLTQEVIDTYNNVKQNRSLLAECNLTVQQVKKIQLLQYIDFPLLGSYNEEDQNNILSQLRSIKANQWIQNIAEGNVDSVSQLIDQDVKNRELSMKGGKQIDPIKIKQTMSNIKLYKELQHLLYSGSVFEKEQIPVPLLQNSRYLNLINNAASVAGLFVEQKLKSRTKDGRTYIFEVKQLISKEDIQMQNE